MSLSNSPEEGLVVSIMQTDKTLPCNPLIFEARHDAAARARVGLMAEVGLSEAA